MKETLIKESSMLFKFLYLLQLAYFKDVQFIGKQNGCPLFWRMIIALIVLPVYLPTVFPLGILVWSAKKFDNYKYRQYRKDKVSLMDAYGTLLAGSLLLYVGWTSFLASLGYLFGLVPSDGTAAFMSIAIIAIVISLLPVIAIILIYILGFIGTILEAVKLKYQNWRSSKSEVYAKKLADKLAKNPEYKTPIDFLKGGAMSFYERHCPKIKWEFNQSNDPTKYNVDSDEYNSSESQDWED